jgi:hypothetical protein
MGMRRKAFARCQCWWLVPFLDVGLFAMTRAARQGALRAGIGRLPGRRAPPAGFAALAGNRGPRNVIEIGAGKVHYLQQ